MFGFNKKKNEIAHQQVCRQLASEATLESVFEGGKYSAFLVRLAIPKSKFSSIFLTKEDMMLFVESIENRLDARDFEPDLAKLNDSHAFPSSPDRHGVAAAVRLVLDEDDALIFKWNH